ncbi:MAG: sugar ABC transporter permease [Verrucomicrobia bacterium]|nr:MAG: sugar ABC transporter permease [Verrucomicrobiota bacterium]
MIQFFFNLFLKKFSTRELGTCAAFALSGRRLFVSVRPHRMSSSGTENKATSRPVVRLQEGGLLVVIFLLGLLLTLFGGRVERPEFKKNAAGEIEKIMVERNKFFNAQNLINLAKDTSFFAVMAVGATFVIICGGIDLSVGAVYALASVLAALVLHRFGTDGPHSSVSPWLCVPLGMAVCIGSATLCGLLYGGMIVALKVHPFIITLGTMTIYRGVAFVITAGQSVGTFATAFPDLVKWEVYGGLRLVPFLVMVLVTILGTVYLTRLAAGRRIYAVGGNELASRYSGVRVERVKLSVYVISGLSAGIAALLAIGYYGSASSGDGAGYELDVIASAVVGGASLSGGRGSALGALLGALIIKMIDNGIVILRIDQSYSRIIIGAVVILAVMLDQFNTWLAKRRLTKTV